MLGLLAAGLGATLFWVGEDLVHPSALKERLRGLLVDLGPWKAVVYILLYWAAPFLFLPAVPLALVSGMVFGTFWGGIWSLIGSTGGCVTGFLMGRAMGHDVVAKRAHGRVLAVKAGIEKEGWRFVAFIRLVPVLPFGIINIVLGTTEISLKAYTITSFICMAPGAFVYAYMGDVGRKAAAGTEGLATRFSIAIGLLALLAGLPAAVRYARSRKEADEAARAKAADATQLIKPAPPTVD